MSDHRPILELEWDGAGKMDEEIEDVPGEEVDGAQVEEIWTEETEEDLKFSALAAWLATNPGKWRAVSGYLMSDLVRHPERLEHAEDLRAELMLAIDKPVRLAVHRPDGKAQEVAALTVPKRPHAYEVDELADRKRSSLSTLRHSRKYYKGQPIRTMAARSLGTQ